MTLSVLIPTLEKRFEMYDRLFFKLKKQIIENQLSEKVQIIKYADNGELSIGEKRNALIEKACGKYICFIDDDDDISDKYIKKIYTGCLQDVDCLDLTGIITINGLRQKKFIHAVRYDYYWEDNEAYYRPPNHLNCIRRSIALQYKFPHKSFSEDTDYAMRMAKKKALKTEYHIDDILYFYKYVSKK
jgi:glycosyltransferase involved in cell wall biosynthesis